MWQSTAFTETNATITLARRVTPIKDCCPTEAYPPTLPSLIMELYPALLHSFTVLRISVPIARQKGAGCPEDAPFMIVPHSNA